MEGVSVVGQQQTRARGSTGDYVDVVRVSFTVDGSGPFSVDIPVTGFTADAAQGAIANYAAHVRQVANL